MNKLRKAAARTAILSRTRRDLHMDALRELVEPVSADPTELFEKGLQLLVKQLETDRAVIVRITDLGYETLWWATKDGTDLDLSTFDPNKNFCPQVVEHAPRTLVIRDAKQDNELQTHTAFQDMSVRSYIGVPLRRGDQVIGVLSVQGGRPKKFSRNDIILVSMVANLMSSAMEIELLKQELHMTREALDLTMSVVEDSALEAATTRLPSRRYMDIWLKAYLFMARRRSEPLALVMWQVRPGREARKALREISDQARGEDLLVDLGKDIYLLLLPRTRAEGAQFLVNRVLTKFGQVPVGVAVWDPTDTEDREDLAIRGAIRRAQESMREALSQGA